MSRPICVTSASSRSRAPARSAPGSCRCLRISGRSDYMTISDVILHIRYTARDGRRTARERRLPRNSKNMLNTVNGSGQALLFCLRYDFPTQWSALVNGSGDLPSLRQAVLPLLGTGAGQPDHRRSDALHRDNREPIHLAGPLLVAPLGGGRAVRAVRRPRRQHLSSPAQPAKRRHCADPRPDPAVFLVLQYHFTAS